MIRYFNRHKIRIIIVSLIIFILIPIGLNIAFKSYVTVSFMQAEWDASAALNFYGTIVASLLGVYGVYLSIKVSNDNYRQDVRNRIMPYLILTQYKTKSSFNIILSEPTKSRAESETNNNYYEEYKIEKIFFILEENNVRIRSSLSKQQEELVQKSGFYWEHSQSESSLKNKLIVSMPLEVENVGNGNATKLRIGLNSYGKEPRYITPLSLKPNKTIYIHIFCDKDSIQPKKYNLEFYYDDILGTRYYQNYPVELYKKRDDGTIYDTIDLTGKQITIEGEKHGKNEI